ncbi:hypothetical protein ACJQWK_11217 [Exserohilum turcicum]
MVRSSHHHHRPPAQNPPSPRLAPICSPPSPPLPLSLYFSFSPPYAPSPSALLCPPIALPASITALYLLAPWLSDYPIVCPILPAASYYLNAPPRAARRTILPFTHSSDTDA